MISMLTTLAIYTVSLTGLGLDDVWRTSIGTLTMDSEFITTDGAN